MPLAAASLPSHGRARGGARRGTEGAAEKIDLVEDEADAERGNAVGGARAEPAGFLSSQWSMAGKIPECGECVVCAPQKRGFTRFEEVIR